jgi:hypothetical protein
MRQRIPLRTSRISDSILVPGLVVGSLSAAWLLCRGRWFTRQPAEREPPIDALDWRHKAPCEDGACRKLPVAGLSVLLLSSLVWATWRGR